MHDNIPPPPILRAWFQERQAPTGRRDADPPRRVHPSQGAGIRESLTKRGRLYDARSRVRRVCSRAMPAPASRARLPRRIAAVLLILSVLTSTLGWAHPPCDMTQDATAATAHDGHGVEMATMGHGAMENPASTETPVSHDCRQHEDHPEKAPDCGMVAHCLQGFTVPAIVHALATADLPDLPAPSAELAPPGPAPAPESPPPRG